MLAKIAMFSLMVLLANGISLGQDISTESTAEKEKKKKETDHRVVELLDRAIADAASLRLAQNRAIVFAMTGDAYWRYDEKRSRDLFRNAASELVAYNLELEREKRENPNLYADALDFGNQSRSEILPLVARRDPELALELLIQTRSTKLNEAILRSSAPNTKSTSDMMNFDPDRQRVSQELALEQQFALLAADANPEKAIKLIRESISKGISSNVIPLLQKLHKKEPKKATELGGDVIKKLVDTDLSKSDDDMRAAMNFLQFAYKPPQSEGKDKLFAFTESQIKDLATKVANTLIQPSRSMTSAILLSQAMPMLQKFVPEKMPYLRQRQAEYDSTMPNEVKAMQQRQVLWDDNSTAEDIIEHLPKLSNEYEKASAYQALFRKIGEVEEEARAKKLIDQIPDEKVRASLMEQFEAARISRSARDGKLEDARKLIGNLKKRKTQIQRLVALAIDFQKKGGAKDKEAAAGLMKDARALISETPETSDELNDTMEVVRGYTSVEPEIAFKLFEPSIDLINGLLDASAVLSKFEGQYGTFKKGEIEFRVNGQRWDQPIFRFIPQMQLLAKADLDKMMGYADRFTRTDSRTIVRLYVLQGFLKDEKELEPPPTQINNYLIY